MKDNDGKRVKHGYENDWQVPPESGVVSHSETERRKDGGAAGGSAADLHVVKQGTYACKDIGSATSSATGIRRNIIIHRMRRVESEDEAEVVDADSPEA